MLTVIPEYIKSSLTMTQGILQRYRITALQRIRKMEFVELFVEYTIFIL